jgi:hypothetical protein
MTGRAPTGSASARVPLGARKKSSKPELAFTPTDDAVGEFALTQPGQAFRRLWHSGDLSNRGGRPRGADEAFDTEPDVGHILRCRHWIDVKFESSILERSLLDHMTLRARCHHQRCAIES